MVHFMADVFNRQWDGPAVFGVVLARCSSASCFEESSKSSGPACSSASSLDHAKP